MMIVAQMVKLARMPCFCKTDVSCSPFFCLFVLFLVIVSLCVGLVALLHFFALICALAKNANVLPKALAYVSLNNCPCVNKLMSIGLMFVKSDLNLTSETLSGILILSTFEMS
jgi:hypothetical protein